DGGEADVLGADDHRTTSGPLMLEVNELLQRSGGEHASRPVTGHQARAAWTLAAASREEYRACIRGREPRRRGHREIVATPAEDRRLGAQLDPRLACQCDASPCVL